MKIFFLCLCLLLAYNSAGSTMAKKYVEFDNSNSGLSNNNVRCLITDSKGYLWIGTEMGLNRFDGTTMERFKPEDYHLPSNYIFALFEDKSGNIWIGTSAGAAYYNYHTDSFVVPADSKGVYPVDIISSFSCDAKGTVWFSPNISDKLFGFDVESKLLTSYPLGLENGPKYITFDYKDRLVLLTDSSVYSYNIPQNKLEKIASHPMGGKSLHRRMRGPVISKTSNEIVYFATEETLNKLDLSTGKIRPVYKWSVSGQFPICLYSMDDGNIQIPTSKGLLIHYPQTEKTETIIDDEFIMGFAPGINGTFWVGLHSKGFRCYSDKLSYFKSTLNLIDGTSLKGVGFTSATQDTDDKVWLATEKTGVIIYDPHTYTAQRCELSGVHNPINAICADGNSIWIGNGDGLFLYNRKKRNIRKINSSPVSRIFKTHSGELLVGNKSTLLCFDNSNDSFHELEGFDIPSLVSQRGVEEDKNGRLWIPTYTSGVYMYDPKLKKTEWFPLDDEESKVGAGGMVTSILVDNSGTVWTIGHNAEIRSLFSSNSFDGCYNTDNIEAFPQAAFLSARQADDGTFWIATSSGLVHFDQQSGETTLFNDNNGLQDNTFLETSKVLLSGDLLFTTASGILQFSPLSFNFEKQSVDVVSFKIGEKKVNLDSPVNELKKIDIPFASNSFGFQFATPGIISPACIQCRLLNYETQWRCLGGKSIYYYNVPQGKYSLQIKGHDDILIEIVPPFWNSVPGILLIVVISLAVTLSVVRVIYVRKRNKEKEKVREKIINEKLGFLSGFIALEQFETNDANADFMKKMDNVVTRHLSDPEFDVEQLAAEMSMSHRTLTRYSASIFQTTPVEYIRTKRLAVASHLLEQGGYSISEVSFKCGFNSPAYFTKCYRDAYGKAPSASISKK